MEEIVTSAACALMLSLVECHADSAAEFVAGGGTTVRVVSTEQINSEH